MRLIIVGRQVSLSVSPHLTCDIGLKAVNIQLDALFHKADYNSPRKARKAGDLSHHGGVLA